MRLCAHNSWLCRPGQLESGRRPLPLSCWPERLGVEGPPQERPCVGRPACRFSMSVGASNTSHQAVSFSGPSVEGRGAGLSEIMALGFQLSRPAGSPPRGSATTEPALRAALRGACGPQMGSATLPGCSAASGMLQGSGSLRLISQGLLGPGAALGVCRSHRHSPGSAGARRAATHDIWPQEAREAPRPTLCSLEPSGRASE